VWDPAQYQRFSDERARPFVELLSRVAAPDPAYVVDLGCGSGDLTATLLERWPRALVEGVDSSAEMMADAERHAIPGRLEFTCADVREWRPERPVDVILANAVLQWVPGHVDLLTRWVEAIPAGGWLAFQVPGNFGAPSHRILADLVRSPRWRERLGDEADRLGVHEPAEYLTHLAALGCGVDAWETTYLHVLVGPDPVLEWTKGTTLRPVLSTLEDQEREAFLADYAPRLRGAYPEREFGTVFPFRRLFVVARRWM
jgi:trans-aconitate 2-methyltransferase